MGLRSKVLVILLGMWAIITAVIYIYSTSTLINNYRMLEQVETIKNIDRARKTLNNNFESVKVLNGDWSKWDDAYKFMQDKNQTFIDSNLSPATFINAKMSLVLFFSPDGKLFYGRNYDLKKNKFIELPTDIIRQLETDKTFTQMTNRDEVKTGILKTKSGYVLLSAAPIVTSLDKGPIRGTLIIGSYLSNEQLTALSELINTKIELVPLPLTDDNPEFTTVLSELKNGAPFYIYVKNKHLMYGYTLIYDIQHQAIGILRIESTRALFNEGTDTINQYLVIIMIIGLIFILVVWLLLEKLILNRMINISKQVVSINSESKFGSRVSEKGNDELAKMAQAINSLMGLIELSSAQLKGRIQQRTEALEQVSRLNKNLYNEITRQKEVEIKLLEDRRTLKQMAYYDTLTGLPNRQSFTELLNKALKEAQEKGTRFAVLFLDADRFKSINDTYGHVFGDQFLIIIAVRLQLAIHNKAIAARISGDEFNILVSNITDRDSLDQLVKNILAAISAPVSIDHITVQHTFSIGISIFPYDGTTIESLRTHADIAMYHAKNQDKNAYCYFADIENIEPMK